MATKSQNKPKKNKAPVVRVKQVLAAPYEISWPQIDPKSLENIRAEFEKCAANLITSDYPVLNWSELRNIAKSARKDRISEHRRDYLLKLDHESRKKAEEKEADRIEKRNHVHLGYNNIMRRLHRGEHFAAVLVNKSIQPDFPAKSFVQACKVRNIPLAFVDSLDPIYRNTIAIAFRPSVRSEGNVFNRLYSAINDAVAKVPLLEDLGEQRLGDVGNKVVTSKTVEKPTTTTSKTAQTTASAVLVASKAKQTSASVVLVEKFYLRKSAQVDVLSNVAAADDFIGVSKSDENFITMSSFSSKDKHENTSLRSRYFADFSNVVVPEESFTATTTTAAEKCDETGSVSLQDLPMFSLDVQGNSNESVVSEEVYLDSGDSKKRKKEHQGAKVLRLLKNPNKKRKTKLDKSKA